MKAAIHEPAIAHEILRRNFPNFRNVAKRLMDLILATVGLLLSAPVWIAVAVAIWLEDGPGVFIRQERTGKDGRLFTSLKFRSMRVSDGVPNRLMDLADDPRITRVGRFLRATALDELPQLWNIFVGDMSFVGPRALPFEVQDAERSRYRTLREVPGFAARVTVRPGLTGIAQVYARRDIGRRQKFRYDLLYVRKWSLWLDIRLILLSVWVSLRGKWESRGPKF